MLKSYENEVYPLPLIPSKLLENARALSKKITHQTSSKINPASHKRRGKQLCDPIRALFELN